MKKLLYLLIALTLVFNMLSCTKTIEIPVEPAPVCTDSILSYKIEGFGFTITVKQVLGDSVVTMRIIPPTVEQDTQFTLQMPDKNGRKLNIWVINLTKDLKEGRYYEKKFTVNAGSSIEKMTIISGGLYFL